MRTAPNPAIQCQGSRGANACEVMVSSAAHRRRELTDPDREAAAEKGLPAPLTHVSNMWK